MANFAAFLVAIVAVVYIVVLICGMIAVFPFGLIGLFVLGGFLYLFLGVLRERAGNEEDDHYAKNVEK